MNQKKELKENEGGILELYVNNRPCVCPFAGQTVFPVPSQIVGQMDLQVFTKKCDSLCPLFVVYPVTPESNSLSVELRCSPTEVHHTNIPLFLFKKNLI